MNSDGGGALGAAFGMVFFLIMMAVAIVVIAGMWKMFEKAGKPGWAAIVPIYNYIVLLEIIGKPLWWIVLFFIPIVNFVAVIMVMLELAKCFGQSSGFAIGLILLSPIFIPILGFGSARYLGPQTLQPPALPAM